MTIVATVDSEIETEMRALANVDPIRDAEQRVQAAAAMAVALRRATIAQTLPQDWVFNGEGDKCFAYLQDSGCQRVAGLWGIEFDKTALRDFQREDLPDGHIRFEVMVTGRSTRTHLERTEIGTRSTASDFFRSKWEKALEEEDTAKQHQLLMDVKKAALTNAHGRVVRALTGMGRMPEEQLRSELGDRAKKVGTVERQQQGGATEGTLKKIAGMACMEQRVQGCDRNSFGAVLEALKGIGMQQRKASDVIKWLEAQPEPVEKAALLQRCGWVKKADAPKAETKTEEKPGGNGTEPEPS
jgi:hypothetical protein